MQTDSAKRLCEKIQRNKAMLAPRVAMIIASSNNADEAIVDMLRVLQFTPLEIEQFRTKINSKSVSSCVLGSDTIQSNVFDTSECGVLLGCKNRIDPVYKEKLVALLGAKQADIQLRLLTEMCTFTADQSNTSSTTQQCTTTQTLDLLMKQPFDPIIQSLIEAVLGGDPLSCDSIPDSYTADNYQKAVQICHAYAGVDQSNVARCASAVTQKNASNVAQKCVISALIGKENEQANGSTITGGGSTKKDNIDSIVLFTGLACLFVLALRIYL